MLNTEPDIWSRRRNLGGVSLVNAIEVWEPLAGVDVNGSSTQQAWGLFPEVLYRLQDKLNFTMIHKWPEDRLWGSGMTESQLFIRASSIITSNSELPNGSWTGLMGMLVSGEADICSGGLNVSPRRAQFIDFTIRILNDRGMCKGKRPSGIYVMPF